MPEGLALVASKSFDSLPITTLRVESEPCLEPNQVSSINGTKTLPNEVMQAEMCTKEVNTGKTYDGRYQATQAFYRLSEWDIMKENSVLDRLYRQKPEKSWLNSGSNSLLAWFTPFTWGNYTETANSEASRGHNTMKLWTRPTIPWKLDCDRDILHREDAIAVFNLDLEHLGFIDYVMVLSVIIVCMMLLPFLVVCCDCSGSKAYIFHELEPLITRILFVGMFIAMLQVIDIEKEQCTENHTKVKQFSKTNVCGDDYSKLDTIGTTDRLSKAEQTLQSMEYALYGAIGLLCVELVGMCCWRIFCKKRYGA